MNKVFFVLFMLLFPALATAQLAVGAFYKQRAASLTFTTAAQNVPVSMCSNVVTVQTKSSAWATVNVGSNLTVNLTTDGSLTFYSDADCENAITSVTISSGQNTASFYYMQNTLGSPVATAAATGYASARQSAYIVSNPYIWMGGGGNANWNNAANWSGGAVPGSGNVAVFNTDCVTNCSPTITANPNVAGVRILSG